MGAGKTAVFQEQLVNAGSLANQRPILDEILPKRLLSSVKPASGSSACVISMCS